MRPLQTLHHSNPATEQQTKTDMDDLHEDSVPVRRRTSARAATQEQGAVVKGTHRKGEEPVEEEVAVPMMSIKGDPAYVSIGGRMTYNLGNYETMQVYANVTLPCENNRKAVEAAQQRASGLVLDFIESQRAEMETLRR